jgi:hypothetical protein
VPNKGRTWATWSPWLVAIADLDKPRSCGQRGGDRVLCTGQPHCACSCTWVAAASATLACALSTLTALTGAPSGWQPDWRSGGL